MKISIPEPCSEDWSKMTPTEKGAFCQKCALEVTDFTNKTSLEIKSILTEKIESKQRVCGHIENRQMIELNSEFIPWKSDQQSFRAVWMFSLIAVFGMTLFSCQSTFSKEMVEKMNVSSMEMIDEEAKDTLDLAKLNDSIKVLTANDSLLVGTSVGWPWGRPYETTGPAVSFQGTFGGGIEIPNWEITTCLVTYGDFILSGFVSTTPPAEKDSNVLSKFVPNPLGNIVPIPETQSPKTNERPQQNSPRIDAKHEKGKPEFSAYVSPLPIDKTSKLFLTIPEEGTLRLSIWELASRSKIHSEKIDLVFGNHAVDINFHEFPFGKYAAQLIWEDEKVVLPFEVVHKALI